MVKVAPYLSFNGTCAEAFAFYKTVFGGTIPMQMRYSEAPTPASDADRDRIMHTRLVLDGQEIMGSDSPSARPHTGVAGMSVMMEFPTVEATHTAFKTLSEGGQVGMPMSETFWTKAFGTVVDRFGTSWLIGCEVTT